MSPFTALLRRESRDARWHVVTSLAVAAVIPFAAHALLMSGADDETAALIGGRGIVPIVFALFAAATASDLVARDVATRRIDALAALPVAIGRVWAAKALFLLAACTAFLAWVVAAEMAAVAVCAEPGVIAALPAALGAAVPSLLGGFALAAATLLFSTTVDRGMAAALGACVVLIAIAWGVHVADIPAAPGSISTFAAYAVPLGLAVTFAAASRAAFVRGPIHGPSKLRLLAAGVVPLVVLGVPGGAAVALAVGHSAHTAPGEGEPSARIAAPSLDGKWVAVQETRAGGASSTWLVGIDDGSCREIAPGNTWFPNGEAWLPGQMLRVHTSSFSVVDGPRHVRALDIEPSRLGVAEESWVHRQVGLPPRGGNWAWVRDAETSTPAHHVVEVVWFAGRKSFACREVVLAPTHGVVFVVAQDGTLTRNEVADGSLKTATTALARGVRSSPVPDGDGRRLLLADDRRVIDATTGAVVLADWDGRARWIGTTGTLLQTWTETATHSVTRSALHDLDAGTTVDLGAPLIPDHVPSVARTRDGRLVVCDGDVTLRAADGKPLRRLFPPQEKGN
jgi:hypothetical protein